MKSGKIDILLGTQMVAKGLYFPGVSVVGVLMADIGLNLPDFRAAERIFSLLVQVAGRSGRGSTSGTVFIQTRDPDHPIFRFIKSQDYESFYRAELDERRVLRYPPFSRIARLLIRGESEELAAAAIESLSAALKKAIEGIDKNVILLGPVAAPVEKIGDNYRYHIILKGRDTTRIRGIIREARDELKLNKKLYLEIDIDPVDMM
jgi:primosomal protein N' (replication factor Y)